jgi:hypothetical protein
MKFFLSCFFCVLSFFSSALSASGFEVQILKERGANPEGVLHLLGAMDEPLAWRPLEKDHVILRVLAPNKDGTRTIYYAALQISQNPITYAGQSDVLSHLIEPRPVILLEPNLKEEDMNLFYQYLKETYQSSVIAFHCEKDPEELRSLNNGASDKDLTFVKDPDMAPLPLYKSFIHRIDMGFRNLVLVFMPLFTW